MKDRDTGHLFVSRFDGEVPAEKFRKAGDLRTPDGVKTRQKDSKEDRAIPFRCALIKYKINATDVDIFVFNNRQDKTVLMIEVTRPDEKVYSPRAYLQEVDERRQNQGNDRKAAIIGKERELPVILVCFEPDIDQRPDARLWRRSIYAPDGKYRDWEEWRAKEFFEALYAFCNK